MVINPEHVVIVAALGHLDNSTVLITDSSRTQVRVAKSRNWLEVNSSSAGVFTEFALKVQYFLLHRFWKLDELVEALVVDKEFHSVTMSRVKSAGATSW